MVLREIMEKLQERGQLKGLFNIFEMGMLGVIVLVAIFMRPKAPESSFSVREADLAKSKKQKKSLGPDLLAEAKIKTPEKPLQLSGIRIDGAAHEILGISLHSNASEIQKAYRDLMKQYHPDRIGRQGSREWNDAQKIAEALNRAKEEMLKRVQNK